MNNFILDNLDKMGKFLQKTQLTKTKARNSKVGEDTARVAERVLSMHALLGSTPVPH